MFVPNLQWLDPDDPEAGKKARAHRQKEFHRAKRWKQTQQFVEEREKARTRNWLGMGDEPTGPTVIKVKGSKMGIKADVPLHFKQFDPTTSKYTEDGGEDVIMTAVVDASRMEETKKANGRRHRAEKLHAGKQESDDAVANRYKERTGVKREQLHDQPWTVLSKFRRDPFAALPGKFDDRDNHLIDYYLNDYGRIVYNVVDSFVHREFWFPLAKTGPIAFQAMAILEPARLMARNAREIDNGETKRLKQKTIRAIHKHMDTPVISVRTNDDILAAILGMAHSENHFGLKLGAVAHFKAVMSLVRQRGGPHKVDDNRHLGCFANWVNYLTMSPATLPELESFSFHPHNLTTHSAYTDLSDLLSFLQSTDSLAESYRLSPKHHQLRRRALFNPDSPIFNICAIPRTYNQWDENLIPVYARLSALFHMHAALLEYHDKSEAREAYLDEVEKAGAACAYDASCSIGVYVHYMLKIDYDECERQASLSPRATSSPFALTSILISEPTEKRSWYVARILRVAKLLSNESLHRLHSKLLSYLDPIGDMHYKRRFSEDRSESGDDEHGESWIEQFRQEILAKDVATTPGGGSVETPGSVSTPAESMRSSPDMWPR